MVMECITGSSIVPVSKTGICLLACNLVIYNVNGSDAVVQRNLYLEVATGLLYVNVYVSLSPAPAELNVRVVLSILTNWFVSVSYLSKAITTSTGVPV